MMEFEAAFIGQVTAGMMHEMKNVLAILKESVGLMQDLVGLAGDGLPKKDKFDKALDRMAEQIVRGIDLAQNLNLFAHLADADVESLNLERTMQHALFISRRPARLKSVTLEIERFDKTREVMADPLHVQFAIHQCMSLVLNALEKESVITFGAQPQGDDTIISIEASNKSLESVLEISTDFKVRLAAMNFDVRINNGRLEIKVNAGHRSN